MSWVQKKISLHSKPRGCHLITPEVIENIPELAKFQVGILHLFVQHTSASLSINENADPDVRRDMESHLNRMIPENAPYYVHTIEGPDDMPAHLKTSIIGSSLTIPIYQGRLNLGLWQGIYLCEHRNFGSGRTLIATIHGEKK